MLFSIKNNLQGFRSYEVMDVTILLQCFWKKYIHSFKVTKLQGFGRNFSQIHPRILPYLDPADALILLMRWSCWCADPANALILPMRWSWWCTDPADALVRLMRRSCWCADPTDAPTLLMCWSCYLADAPILPMCCSCWCTDADDSLMLMMHWCADVLMLLNQDQESGLADWPFCSNFL